MYTQFDYTGYDRAGQYAYYFYRLLRLFIAQLLGNKTATSVVKPT